MFVLPFFAAIAVVLWLVSYLRNIVGNYMCFHAAVRNGNASGQKLTNVTLQLGYLG